MKIRYLSDLHLEFIKPKNINSLIKQIPLGTNDICVLSGDIGNPYSSNYDNFMKSISTMFKKVFVIPGNHEYYNKTKLMEETEEYMINYFTQYENISFLNNSYEIYENKCFIGTTLWSKIKNPEYKINDVYQIPNFDYKIYNQLNKNSIKFLIETLEQNNNCIIITHHMPSEQLIDKKYKTVNMIPYNQWFYSDLDNIIDKYKDKINCWFYGHTHTASISRIHNIPFLCNPIGYPNENDKIDYKKNIIIN